MAEPSDFDALLLMAASSIGNPIYNADLADFSSAPTLLLRSERLSPDIICLIRPSNNESIISPLIKPHYI